MNVLAALPKDMLQRVQRALAADDCLAVHSAGTHTDIDVAVVDPTLVTTLDGSNAGSAPRVSAFSLPDSIDPRSLSGVPVLLYSRLAAGHKRSLLEALSIVPAVGLVLFDFDDSPASIAAELRDCALHIAVRGVISLFQQKADKLPSQTIAALTCVFSKPGKFKHVQDLALASGVSRRTLDRQLASANVACADDLLRVARVTSAYALLLHSNATAAAVAATLGYRRYDRFLEDVRGLVGCPPLRLVGIPRASFVAQMREHLHRPLAKIAVLDA